MKLALLTAVHGQALSAAVKLTVPVPAALESDALVESSVNEQELPNWFTVNVWPAIVSVPLRALDPGFAVTE